MSKKIERLTDEQVAQLPVYRDKWLAIGLSTEPLDLEKAKSAAIKAYKLAGLKPPQRVFHFQSPMSAALGASILKNGVHSKAPVGAQVSAQVWAQVRDQVSAQVGDQVWAQVSAQVWAQVRAQVGAQVRAQVGAQVRAQVRDQVYGPHDAHWLGFFEYFKNEIGIAGCGRLDGLIDLAQHCGWWAPYENAVILQDRPAAIRWDDQQRLHNETGMAVEYRDGFGVYSWHGTRIPGEWLDGKTLTPQIALTHDNVEQRRAACEILTWEVILNELNATTIEKDADPEVGELVEVDIPDIGRERFLRVRCGTGRRFALPVPPEMTTALQANCWTYGIDETEFNPEVRT